MNRKIFQLGFTLVFVLAVSIPTFPQADVSTATIKGTITDPNNAVIAGGTITAKSVDRGITRIAKTDRDGVYQISLLQPGAYEVTIEATGFETKVANNVQLTVGQTQVLDLQLGIQGVSSQVAITAESPLIETERTQQANTIEKRQIESLPNVGRDFTAYVYTLPGVANSNAPRVQGAARFSGFGSTGFSIGGSNGRDNLVTVDGGENEYGSGQLRFALSPEVIQEFQVNRNSFAAEFGFTSGTAVNVVTKSGTNDFHGGAYVYYRSQKTSARNPFDFNATEPFDQQVYPGFSLGGPIVKNRAFFFTNYEKQRNDIARFRNYTTSNLLQPDAAQASLLGKLDQSASANVRRISQNLRAALFTTPSNFPTTFNMLSDQEGTFTGFSRFNTWTSRLDYQISEHDSLTGRFTMTRNFTDDLGAGNSSAPSFTRTLTVRDYTTLVNWNRTFSPTLVNQARVQLAPNNSALTEPREPIQAGIVLSNLASFGRGIDAPYLAYQDRYQFEDTLSWSNNGHTFKFGGSYRPVKYKLQNDYWFAGEFTFSPSTFPVTLAVPVADRAAFVGAAAAAGVTGAAVPTLNSVQSFNFNLPRLFRQGFNNPVWESTAHYLGFFAQDSWKLHRRFTLDFGGRVDYDGEPEPAPHHTYFSPRLGFAWDVTGDSKTILRGGGGIFYAPIHFQITAYTNLLGDSGKFVNNVFYTGLNAATIYQNGIAQGKYPFSVLTEAELQAIRINNVPIFTGAKGPGRVVIELDPNYKNNYSIQANLGIQRQLTNNLSVELAYQMYRGVHIQMPVALNYIESATPNPLGAAFGPLYRVCQVADNCPRVSDPTILQFTEYQSRGNSIYHGMTASLTKRFSNYISFQGNYTFSRAIDDTTDFNSNFAPPFPDRLFLERSLSSFDIRHNFVFSGVFQSPFKAGPDRPLYSRILADINLSPAIFIRSGIPFSLLTGADTNGDTRAFNDRLFKIGRNTGIGPNFRSVNMRLSKAFRFKNDSPMRFEFSADGSNLFNRANYAAVREVIGTNLNSPDYLAGTTRLKGRKDRDFRKGEPLSFTSAFAPRQILFGLKFAF